MRVSVDVASRLLSTPLTGAKPAGARVRRVANLRTGEDEQHLVYAVAEPSRTEIHLPDEVLDEYTEYRQARDEAGLPDEYGSAVAYVAAHLRRVLAFHTDEPTALSCDNEELEAPLAAALGCSVGVADEAPTPTVPDADEAATLAAAYYEPDYADRAPVARLEPAQPAPAVEGEPS